MDFLNDFRRYLTKPHVRPWALSSPILVLLICLPLLRPLRHPDPRDISADEAARLATVRAIVEHRTLSLDDTLENPPGQTIRGLDGRRYSDQPPVMSALLSGSYWAMHRRGLTLEQNPILVPFLLTIIAVTLPVAGAAGLVYRMGRLFELARPIRAALGAAVVLGSGLLSYGVVLNAHAPAAVLVMCAAACFVHLAIAKRSVRSIWLMWAGFCAALAATIEPAAALFALLFAVVPLAMRWRPTMRVGGVVLYAIGMTAPLALHAALTLPITGDILPGMFHPELVETNEMDPAQYASAPEANPQWRGRFSDPVPNPAPTSTTEAPTESPPRTTQADSAPLTDEDSAQTAQPTWWSRFRHGTSSVFGALFGAHGLFSHFPVLILGLAGVGAIMHRHWPTATKVMAAATVAGASVVVFTFATATPARTGSMFAARWFIVFLPMLLFWSGVWVRRKHHAVTWSIAGLLLAFSIGVSLIGATNPLPRAGYARYTAAEALHELLHPTPTPPNQMLLAGG